MGDGPRIRTTHTGSLPRPPALLAAVAVGEDGVDPRIAWAKLRALAVGAALVRV